jgi:AcrR family transcriptional regulator
MDSTSPAAASASSAPHEDLTAKARIRRAALELFATRGFEATSIRSVAMAAGVTHGLVRHHFGSKEGLRQAVDLEVLGRVREMFYGSLARDADSPAEAMRRLRTFIGFLGSEPMTLDYLARTMLERGPRAGIVFRLFYDGARAELIVLEKAGLARSYADDDIRALLLASLILGPALLRPLVEERLEVSLSDREVVERLLDAGWDMFEHGLFTRKGSVAAERVKPNRADIRAKKSRR